MSWRTGIHGYAARWGVVTAPTSRPNAPHLSRPARFERGCFNYYPDLTEVMFMHRDDQVVGRGADLGLRMWEDRHGLAFSFVPPPTPSAWGLVLGIADGRYNQCSVGFIRTASTPIVTVAGTFDSIVSAELHEFSIAPRGACPGAFCWHAGTPDAEQPPAVAAILPDWRVGRALAPYP